MRYFGEGWPLFWLAMKTGLLALITLGIYRFWGKTRIRQYIWGSTELDGDRFEYTGTGLEKFLGFLLAVVMLAVYLGLFQIILFFFGLQYAFSPDTDVQILTNIGIFYLSFFAVIPFILFALYRARRYRYARTRWRGIRFGMEKGAWGYVWRALAHGALTVVTLGILLPRQTFYLNKYMVDKSWFGDAQFQQEGRWQALYPAMKDILFGAIATLGPMLLAVWFASPVWGLLSLVGAVWLIIGAVAYRVKSFAYLADNTVLDGQIRFRCTPRTGQVVLTYILGSLGITLALFGLGIVLAILGAAMGGVPNIEDMATPAGPSYLTVAVSTISYLVTLVAVGAATLALIQQPILAHYIDETMVHNLDAVDGIRQRMADAGADAEGFADALDIGGAF